MKALLAAAITAGAMLFGTATTADAHPYGFGHHGGFYRSAYYGPRWGGYYGYRSYYPRYYGYASYSPRYYSYTPRYYGYSSYSPAYGYYGYGYPSYGYWGGYPSYGFSFSFFR